MDEPKESILKIYDKEGNEVDIKNTRISFKKNLVISYSPPDEFWEIECKLMTQEQINKFISLM